MFARREVSQLFPSCVWLHELADHQALNEPMAAELAKLREVSGHALSDQGAWQSRGDLHRQPAFQPLVKCIGAACSGVMEFLRYRVEGFEITDCWANINPPGQAHPIHHHPNNFLSGVYYLQAPKNCGNIVFHDPRLQAIVLLPEVSERTPLNAVKHRFEPKAGQLLVFHSWFQHWVEANKGEQDRISIAFNIMLKGPVGRESAQAVF